MWGLWFVPLIIVLFIAGSAAGIIWYFVSPSGSRPKVAAALAIPLGCVAAPVVGITLLAMLGSFLEASDTQLYEELFGYRSSISEDRMMFDDFGSGAGRELFMRVEPTDAERKRLLAIPGLVESDHSLDQFVARGAQHGFTWWISANPLHSSYCESARMLDAHGFRGWSEFRLVECLSGGEEFPGKNNEGRIFVVASGRP